MIKNNLAKLTLAALVLPIIISAGCSDRYRYECHDPANWETERCQRPICEIHRDCPDMLLGLVESNDTVTSSPSISNSSQNCSR